MSMITKLSPALIAVSRTPITYRAISTLALRTLHSSPLLSSPPSTKLPFLSRPLSSKSPKPTTSPTISTPSPSYGRLANKIAIVTGSSSGIGRGIALAYAKEGAKVLCSDLEPLAKVDIGDEKHVGTHDLIMQRGGVAAFRRCDVSVEEEVESLVKEAVERWGRLDVMVNNAGVALEMDLSTATSAGKVIHECPTEVYDKTMQINARGMFLGCKYAIKQMMTQEVLESGDRGWVVNLASIAGLVGMGGSPAYCSSKGATVLLTKQVAVDYGKHKIHVNCICPGAIQTAMVKPFSTNKLFSGALLAEHPWGSFGEPKHIAGAAVFLASEDSGWVTGIALPVDGGLTAR